MATISDSEAKATRPYSALCWFFWIAAMVGFSIPPIVNYIRYDHIQQNKDYDNWYDTGRLIAAGGDLYPDEQDGEYRFMYPPVAAVLLSPFTLLGKLPFIIFLEIVTSISWVICVFLGVSLATGKAGTGHPLVYLIPGVITAAYVSDMYLLGQPNLMLLAVMLGAFACLRAKREWSAGALIAFATACKAFPCMAIGYLIYRRHWKAAFSMCAGVVILLLFVPIPVRGYQRNLDDVTVWVNSMVLKYDKDTIAQRPDMAFRWKNQSLVASMNRLLRHVPAEVIKQKENGKVVAEQALYVNVADVDFQIVNRVVTVVGLSICFFYIGMMPRYAKRTNQSNAIEFAMLLVMMTIFSPISWFYYGMWLLYPFMVIVNFIVDKQRTTAQKITAVTSLACALVLLNFVPPWAWYRPIRAIGTPFYGYVLLLIEMGWMLWITGRAAAQSADLSAPGESNGVTVGTQSAAA